MEDVRGLEQGGVGVAFGASHLTHAATRPRGPGMGKNQPQPESKKTWEKHSPAKEMLIEHE